jgi:hypothetical protein
MFHGNAVRMSDMAAVADPWVREGWNVVLADYPGYDGDAGRPSEASMVASGEAAWSWARSHGADPSSTVIVANSLGSGPGAALARSAGPRGLLLVSGFDDLADVVRERVPFLPSLLVFDRYRNAEAIGDLPGWTAVWHARDDAVIGYDQGAALARAAGVSVRQMPGGHDIFWKPELQDQLRAEAATMVGMGRRPVRR